MLKRLINRENTTRVRYYELVKGEVISDEIDRVISTEIEEDGYIIVRDSSNKKIGSINIIVQEYDRGPETHYIKDLSIDHKYNRMGIGTECLRHYMAYHDCDILYAATMDQRGERSDGSQLIGAGGPFIAKMRSIGLVFDPETHLNEPSYEG